MPLRKIKKIDIASFLSVNNLSSKILLVFAVLSLLIANIPVIDAPYIHFWQRDIPFLYDVHLPHTPALIINDILMPFFFFMVSAEIRHEMQHGSLNSIKKATLPLVGAIGGIVMPAIIYSFFNKGMTENMHGWAIPTATDIAFSAALLSVLKDRVSNNAKVFLLALAIFDDLGAIIIIAFFYGETIKMGYFSFVLALLALMYLMNRQKKVAPFSLWMALLAVLWYFLHRSGMHATIAGVIAAFALPQRYLTHSVKRVIYPIEIGVLPLFVLANTAISFHFSWETIVVSLPIILGIVFGLFIGKPLGIFLIVRFIHRAQIISMPRSMNIVELLGIGIISGIGFTMSLFVSALSFNPDSDNWEIAKLSVLFGSAMAGLGGILWFKIMVKPKPIPKLIPHQTKKNKTDK